MTLYLIRWHWIAMKRQLRTRQGFVPLLFNLIMQVSIVVFTLILNTRDVAQMLTFFLAMISVYSLMQVTIGYSNALLFTSLGLLGIAPISGRAKSALALFSMSFYVGINALLLALGVGIALGVRYDPVGGIFVALILAVAVSCFIMGLGAAYTSWVMAKVPAKHKRTAAAMIGVLLLLVLVPTQLVLQKYAPGLSRAPGYALISMAQHPLRASDTILVFALIAAFGLALAAVPFVGSISERASRVSDMGVVDARAYRSRSAPRGLIRLFQWRQRIVISRNRLLWALPLVFALFSLMPGSIGGFWTMMVGIQFGGLTMSSPVYHLAPIEPLRLWRVQMAALLPFVSGFTVFVLVIQSVVNHAFAPMKFADGLAMAALGFCAVSWVSAYFRRSLIRSNTGESGGARDTQGTARRVKETKNRWAWLAAPRLRKGPGRRLALPEAPGSEDRPRPAGVKGRRREASPSLLASLVLMFSSGVFPLAIVMINEYAPAVGLALDLVLIAAVLLAGPPLIRRKRSLHYWQ